MMIVAVIVAGAVAGPLTFVSSQVNLQSLRPGRRSVAYGQHSEARSRGNKVARVCRYYRAIRAFCCAGVDVKQRLPEWRRVTLPE